jgi:peptidoglycan hydrolase-like protein with peptidoglycan-binding domain
MHWYYLRILVILFYGISFFSDPVIANNVLEAQKMLTKLGYAPGPIDGAYGGKTNRALIEY